MQQAHDIFFRAAFPRRGVGLELRSAAYQTIRLVLGWRVKDQPIFRSVVEDAFGLEIGGPSGVFADSGALPLYRNIAKLDNCVFARKTVWEGDRAEARTFCFHPKKPQGFNFIREATDLSGIADQTYDFILSSHNLEHIANPLKALKEWIRVAKPGGAVIVVLPDYRRTFDHRRYPTPVDHMVEDLVRGVDESDQTHLDDVLRNHDLSRDPAAGDLRQFRERCLRNLETRCLHHHVFDDHNSKALLEAAGLLVLKVELVRPHHIVLLSRSKQGAHFPT